MTDNLIETISDAKKYLRENFESGCACPACGQFVKRYNRKITSSMAFILIQLYHKAKDDFIHVENHMRTIGKAGLGGDYVKMKFWNLIEQKPMVRQDGSPRGGYWKISRGGIMFVEKEISVPKYAYIYNDAVDGYSDEKVTITQCLGDKFDYDELMGYEFPSADEAVNQLYDR